MRRGRRKAVAPTRGTMQRISVERCRELLGAAAKALTDEQVITLRDDYYTIALALCRQYQRERGGRRE